MSEARTEHGGPDHLGVPAHDFSTNNNACGPCPDAWQAVQAADAQHYPDPQYADLRARLAQHHAVSVDRILLAGSASEFIQRITAWVSRSSHGKTTTQTTPSVYWPAQAYGDYARAARAWGLSSTDTAAQAQLIWLCEPSSPLGQSDADAPARVAQLREHQQLVLDLAYEPLRLSGQSLLLQSTAKDRVWQMWTPNKALGMTGVRAAYVIAPEGAQEAVDHLQALAPSWVMGAHGVALLHAWCEPSVQQWLLTARQTLREWKAQQITLCESFGWQVHASEANYFAARLPQPLQDEQCKALRSHGVKLRDATSFGLPDWVRVGVRSPASQAVLAQAWHNLGVSA